MRKRSLEHVENRHQIFLSKFSVQTIIIGDFFIAFEISPQIF